MSFSWFNLPKPIELLAPMEDVTDCAFREMFARHGKPHAMFTEFVSVDGLMHDEGRKKLSLDLAYSEQQRPIIAQIWGRDPEKFARVAEYLLSLGFDGIDINMGCPQSKEIQAGACAALIREPKLAQEIVRAAKKGAGNLPVSVKTRVGYSQTKEMSDWVKYLLETEIELLTLHARTKKEMSKVPAHWEKISEAVGIRNDLLSKTLIVGNGDVLSRQDGLEKVQSSGADGYMIGRGAFGKPWLFSGGMPPTAEQRLQVMLEHCRLFEQLIANKKSFMVMRKHVKAYCSGFPGAAELRARLLETADSAEVQKVLQSHGTLKAA